MTSDRIEREARAAARCFANAPALDGVLTVNDENLLAFNIAAAIERTVRECADAGGAAESDVRSWILRAFDLKERE